EVAARIGEGAEGGALHDELSAGDGLVGRFVRDVAGDAALLGADGAGYAQLERHRDRSHAGEPADRGPPQRRRVRRETHGETGMIALLRGRIGRGTAEWFRCAMMDAISQTVRGSCGEVVSLLGGVVDVRSVVNCGLSGVG